MLHGLACYRGSEGMSPRKMLKICPPDIESGPGAVLTENYKIVANCCGSAHGHL